MEPSERKCMICVDPLSTDAVLDLLPKHLAKLDEISRERGDGLIDLLHETRIYYVHKKCYIRYVNFLSVAKNLTEKLLNESEGDAAFNSFLDLNQYFGKCVVCDSAEDAGLLEASPNQQKRLKTASLRKHDEVAKKLGKPSTKVHEECYAAYVPDEKDDSGFSEKLCAICDQDLLDDVLEVTLQRREKLVGVSDKRQDELARKIQDLTELQVHDKCFRRYTHHKNVAKAQKEINKEPHQESDEADGPQVKEEPRVKEEVEEPRVKDEVHQESLEGEEEKSRVKDEAHQESECDKSQEAGVTDKEEEKPKSKRKASKKNDEAKAKRGPKTKQKKDEPERKRKSQEDEDPKPKGMVQSKRSRTEENPEDEPQAKRRKNSVAPALELVGEYFRKHGENTEVALSQLIKDYENTRSKKPSYTYIVKKLKEQFGDDLKAEKSKDGDFLLKYRMAAE